MGRAPVWGSEFTSKEAAIQGGMIVVLRPLFAAALVVRRRYFINAPRPFPAAPQVLDRDAHADARGATHVLGRDVQTVARGAARCALHVHGRGARTDAYGRSFAVLSTQVSTVGLRLGWRVAACLK